MDREGDNGTPMIPLGGLWKNKSQAGQMYLSGKLSPMVKIFIFPNRNKQSDNQPDFYLFLARVETRNQEAELEKEIEEGNENPFGD